MSVADDFSAARDRLPALRADYAPGSRESGSGIEYSETDFPGLRG